MVAAVGYPYTDALVLLQDLTQWTVDPVLSAAELTRLLRYAGVADEDGNEPDVWPTWAASTAYSLNYRVVPVTRNGYVYKATVAGLSDTTQPTWDTDLDDTFTDGTVTWTVEATADWTPTYSQSGLYAAAYEGWMLKYRKLTAGETFGADGASFNPEQRRKDILIAADQIKKAGGGIGSFRLTGRTSRIENWDSTGSLSING